jgi:hypothetical protein
MILDGGLRYSAAKTIAEWRVGPKGHKLPFEAQDGKCGDNLLSALDAKR